jgi:pimeloyl-ACP methyl ester carboxylesterase
MPAIDTLEAIRAGGTTQWIRVRGTDASNPVLLLIHQGPGLPMINEARRFGHVLGLEQAFTVVYWDQRGCGRSLRHRKDRAGITLEAMVTDTVSLLELLRNRFARKTHVAGFSFGGTVGAYAAARRPDLVATLVAVGMDIDGAAAGTSAYDFALAAARQRGHRRATRQLQAIGPPPHLTPEQFTTRVRWATNFGGVTTGETYATLARGLLASLVRSPDYRPRTSSGPSAVLARPRPRCCPSWPPWTWPAPCPASTCPWSWRKAAATRWHPAQRPSGTPAPCRRRASAWSGSTTPRTRPTWKNPASSGTSRGVQPRRGVRRRLRPHHPGHRPDRYHPRRSPDASAQHRLAEMIGRLVPPGDVNG